MDSFVLHPATLAGLIHFLLKPAGTPTTVVVCSQRADFEHLLLHSLTQAVAKQQAQDESTASPKDEPAEAGPTQHPLLQRTLRMVHSSRSVEFAFIQSLPALYAYLSVFELEIYSSDGPSTPRSRLVLLNPVAFHREESCLSAQTLSRVFAAAWEAAQKSKTDLIVCETSDPRPVLPEEAGAEDLEMAEGIERGNPESWPEQNNIWDEEIPILDSATKSYGTAGEKARMVRNCKMSDVAGRWCRFKNLE